MFKADDVYPLTIVSDRYSGTYSGGKYTAWNLRSAPDEVWYDDVTCATFFSSTDIPYGVGNTPEEAVEDLKGKLKGGNNENSSGKVVDCRSFDYPNT